MKLLGKYLSKKRLEAPSNGDLDNKTIFYLFETVIREEYGRRGSASIKPRYYKDGKIFVNIFGSNWANELWMSKKDIVRKINSKIGNDEIKDISVS